MCYTQHDENFAKRKKKKKKRTNNDLQNTIYRKLKIEPHEAN